jgi:hypothetical protein
MYEIKHFFPLVGLLHRFYLNKKKYFRFSLSSILLSYLWLMESRWKQFYVMNRIEAYRFHLHLLLFNQVAKFYLNLQKSSPAICANELS